MMMPLTIAMRRRFIPIVDRSHGPSRSSPAYPALGQVVSQFFNLYETGQQHDRALRPCALPNGFLEKV
jgi:hypothetical protein